MKRLLSAISWILALPLILVVVCVVFPLSIIFATLRYPAKMKRLTNFRNAITTRWFPAKKFIYLEYDRSGELADFVEHTLLPAYGKHIVVFYLDSWTYRDTAFEPEAKTLGNDILGIDRCDLQLAVATLSPEILHDTTMLGPDDPKLAMKQRRLVKKIEACLKSHGVLPKHTGTLAAKSTI
ncbi:MAG TPA: hypothetical protein VFO38_04705 [Candidatus Saccharimonadales bacterium]|nr:hypothetical protein [Candidatus Saccharimonadales bacterium]